MIETRKWKKRNKVKKKKVDVNYRITNKLFNLGQVLHKFDGTANKLALSSRKISKAEVPFKLGNSRSSRASDKILENRQLKTVLDFQTFFLYFLFIFLFFFSLTYISFSFLAPSFGAFLHPYYGEVKLSIWNNWQMLYFSFCHKSVKICCSLIRSSLQ